MKMPELPKQNKTLESDFGVYLKNWIDVKKVPITTAFELKQTSTNSISFSCVESKQVAHGMLTKSHKGVWIRVQGLNGEQDYIWLVGEPSHIVIKYPAGFVFIDIETFVLERDRSKRKSLTWDRAQEIAIRVVKK